MNEISKSIPHISIHHFHWKCRGGLVLLAIWAYISKVTLLIPFPAHNHIAIRIFKCAKCLKCTIPKYWLLGWSFQNYTSSLYASFHWKCRGGHDFMTWMIASKFHKFLNLYMRISNSQYLSNISEFPITQIYKLQVVKIKVQISYLCSSFSLKMQRRFWIFLQFECITFPAIISIQDHKWQHMQQTK